MTSCVHLQGFRMPGAQPLVTGLTFPMPPALFAAPPRAVRYPAGPMAAPGMAPPVTTMAGNGGFRYQPPIKRDY